MPGAHALHTFVALQPNRPESHDGLRLKSVMVGDPTVTGYSICWSNRPIAFHAHRPGDDFTFYRETDSLGTMVTWTYLPLRENEFISRAWWRDCRLSSYTFAMAVCSLSSFCLLSCLILMYFSSKRARDVFSLWDPSSDTERHRMRRETGRGSFRRRSRCKCGSTIRLWAQGFLRSPGAPGWKFQP
jgi:hypothetical protein